MALVALSLLIEGFFGSLISSKGGANAGWLPMRIFFCRTVDTSLSRYAYASSSKIPHLIREPGFNCRHEADR